MKPTAARPCPPRHGAVLSASIFGVGGQSLDDDERPRLNRRDLIRKGAIVVGAAWTVPLIQTIPANAAVGSQPPCGADGTDCEVDSQCCSGFCLSGKCGQNPCLPLFATCTDPSQCCSGHCPINPISGTGICIF
jgi:hypothetical protein